MRVWRPLNPPDVNHTYTLKKTDALEERTMRNWEDWAMAMPLALVPVLALTLGEARGPSLASEAIAAEQPKPQYMMTITAKRLPAECRGIAEESLPAHCLAVLDATTVTMRKTR